MISHTIKSKGIFLTFQSKTKFNFLKSKFLFVSRIFSKLLTLLKARNDLEFKLETSHQYVFESNSNNRLPKTKDKERTIKSVQTIGSSSRSKPSPIK